jgi:hypothetical protein
VSVDRVKLGYDEGQRRQEELVLEGPAPGIVLRATQFYECPGQLLARSPGPLALVPHMRVQPATDRTRSQGQADLRAVALRRHSPDPVLQIAVSGAEL